MVVVFRQKWLYSGKVVVFRHSGCIWEKMLYSGKVVLFLQKCLISGEVVVIRPKWLHSGKVVAFG